jgi:hypothetical protein
MATGHGDRPADRVGLGSSPARGAGSVAAPLRRCLGIIVVVLLPLHEGFDVERRDDPSRLPRAADARRTMPETNILFFDIGGTLADVELPALKPLRDVPDGRGSGVAPDVQGNPVADRPAAGAACPSMTEAVVRCDSQRCGASRRRHSNKFRRHEAASDRLRRSAERPCGFGSSQQRTIARATLKSGEYRGIRGRTYCPGATIGGIPI